MNNLALRQTTDQNQARLYIQKIYDLVQSGEQFPVDLDEVWMINHSSRDAAIENMKYNKFREGVDFQIFPEFSGKNTKGRPKTIYKLTINCFEHFIVRKIDWLFEIYRRTFHGVLSGQIKPIDFNNPVESAEAVVKYAQQAAQYAQLYIKQTGALEQSEGEKVKALQKAEAFSNQLQLVKPKVDFAEKAMISKELIDIGQAAKILELPFGRNTLFSKLRLIGILFKDRNEPKQSYVERGYFKLKEMLINSEGNIPQVYTKVFVTQRGLNFLRKLFFK